jgi:hypothetical protein
LMLFNPNILHHSLELSRKTGWSGFIKSAYPQYLWWLRSGRSDKSKLAGNSILLVGNEREREILNPKIFYKTKVCNPISDGMTSEVVRSPLFWSATIAHYNFFFIVG